MTRAQRSLHRMIWPFLVIMIVVGVVLALWLRPPPDDDDDDDAQGIQRTIQWEQPA